DPRRPFPARARAHGRALVSARPLPRPGVPVRARGARRSSAAHGLTGLGSVGPQRRRSRMADHGLFVGWGAVVPGREAKSLDVFGQVVELYGKLQADGRIESFDVAFLEPHGGDLEGFALIRGTREQMDAVQTDPDFRSSLTRGAMVVQNL